MRDMCGCDSGSVLIHPQAFPDKSGSFIPTCWHEVRMDPPPPGQPPLRPPGQGRLLWSALVPPGLHGVCPVRSGRRNARLEGGRRVVSDSTLLGPYSRSGVVVVAVADSLSALSCGCHWQIQTSEFVWGADKHDSASKCHVSVGLTCWPDEVPMRSVLSAADGRSEGAAAFNHLVACQSCSHRQNSNHNVKILWTDT